MNIKESAQQYVSKKTLNVTELSQLDLELEVLYEEDTEYPYNYVVVDDIRYRIPNTVLSQIKTILSKFPNIKTVVVLKDGKDLDTRYQTIPIQKQ